MSPQQREESAPIPNPTWWRADRYELLDGVIRPHPEAHFERYDPWKQYRSAMLRPRRKAAGDEKPARGRRPSGRDVEEPFYQPLLSLVTRLARADDGEAPTSLTPDLESELLAWCARFGLLGVLPHMVQAVVFPPRWENIPGRVRLQAVSRGYERGSSGWHEREGLLGLTTADSALDGALVEASRLARLKPGSGLSQSVRVALGGGPPHHGKWPASALARLLKGGGVLLRSLHDASLEFADLNDPAWAGHFSLPAGNAGSRWPFPGFGDEAFWRIYGEPLPAFIDAAQILVKALEMLAAARDADFQGDRDAWRRDACNDLNNLTLDAPQVLRSGIDGTLSVAYATPSLLASMALMVQKDVGGGATVSRCSYCGTPVVSGIKWTAYCSTACRWNDQKARQRMRKREAPHLAAEGLSVEEIAERLGARPETVARWIAPKKDAEDARDEA